MLSSILWISRVDCSAQRDIRLSQAKADKYKAREYRSKLDAAYTRLKKLKERVKRAPVGLHTAELNERLAQQSDDRVGERLRISVERQETDEAVMSKDRAVERLVKMKMVEIKVTLPITPLVSPSPAPFSSPSASS